MNDFSEHNKKAVLGSVVVAKAMVRRADKRIEHIVVFQESTEFEFYWIFAADNENTPRRAWKYASHWRRAFGMDSKTPNDFGAFVAHYARTKQGQVLDVRVFHPKRMAALLTKTNHSTIHADWAPQDLSAATFEKVQAKAAKAFQLRGYYFNNRNTVSETATLQMPNEVLVYEDQCEECGMRHSFAHFPDGKKICKAGYIEMKKNPGFEYRGFQQQVGFRFTYRTFSAGA